MFERHRTPPRERDDAARSRPGRARGYTLLELMTTVTVVGVLSAMAVPAVSPWIRNQRLVTATNSMVIGLNYARNEAIKRDSAAGVQLCASSDQATCNTNNWALGWIVWDVASATVLTAAPALTGSLTVTEALAQPAVTYLPSGAVLPGTTFAFTACDSRGATYARELEVNAMGRIASSPNPGLAVNNTALVCP
jgi:type IV fimbrial biogenesis protein FimT